MDYYLGNDSPIPRLPFYWGDLGFRLFVTHGQWRDPANSRAQPDRQAMAGSCGYGRAKALPHSPTPVLVILLRQVYCLASSVVAIPDC
jgi:hypothetical protein